MDNSKQSIEDLDVTLEEKRLSRIAAKIWGVDPVQHHDDGGERSLVWLDRSEGKVFKASLGDYGVVGTSVLSKDEPLETDGWTPVHADEGLPVLQNGKYKYDAYGDGEIVYEDGDHVYENMCTALVKALDFERRRKCKSS